MSNAWFSWVVQDYQKEVIDVVKKLNLRMVNSTDPEEFGCIAIYVDPPEGYKNATIISKEDHRIGLGKLHQTGEWNEQIEKTSQLGLKQIESSCHLEAEFGPHIWFEARRGCPSAYFGEPESTRIGEVYTLWNYAHMIAWSDHWPREGLVIYDEEINTKMKMLFPKENPGDYTCSFMCGVGMIFPEWLKL